MESELTLEELFLILEGTRERDKNLKTFYAAFKGVDLDKETKSNEPSLFEQTKMAADAAKQGLSQEQYVFNMIGIDVDIDDDSEEEVN